MSKQYTVTIKWGKETYGDVQVDMGEPPSVFKAKIHELTGVVPSKQKVLLKGGTLGDSEWAPCRVKKNQVVMVMGTRDDDALQAPTTKPVFIEDMVKDAKLMDTMAPGLVNLGNTCYMNATLQCLARVTPLREAMEKASGSANAAMGKLAMSLFSTMDKAQAATPETLEQTQQAVEQLTGLVLLSLRERNPRFGERGERGGFAQQDADECLGEFMRAFQDLDQAAVQSVFGLELEQTMQLKEAEGTEPAEVKRLPTEQALSYTTDKPGHVHAGILAYLNEEVEKNSETLGRSAVYDKKVQVQRLPAYLVLKGVRFQYHDGHKRKILRPVKYSTQLDMYDMCTADLKERLKPMRNQMLEANNARVEAQKGKKQKTDDGAMEVDSKAETSYSFPDDAGSNCHGYYDLVGVLSHRGRSSDSGHYIAWTKQKNGQWLKFDDDKVSETTWEKVLDIAGGRPDSDIGYILFYESQAVDLST